MKPTFIAKFLTLCVIAAFACSCGYSVGRGGEGEGISVTISPPDGASDQPVDIDVTAEFSHMIEQPSSWADVYSLKMGGTGDNLCTDFTYSTQSRIATCHHDDLDPDESYEVRVSGVLQVNGEIVNFGTVQ
jgi:hypothetical protein